uniref:Ubiquitin-like-conjugating enzyme ATG10 n=1 Tax=Clastoptera arizonana TaxID=38151 RepID=A0A1B6CTH3_9HEMI
MTWEEFLKYVYHFLSVSDEVKEGWTWKELRLGLGGSYLVQQRRERVNNVNEDNYSINGEDFKEQLEDEEENDICSIDSNHEVLTWEYHVLYNPSYATPVLYFNVWNASGKLLALDDVWKMLNVPSHALVEKWQLVTQQEHPLLMRPFFQLHPCKTSQLLSNFSMSKVNPLVSWLSSIGPFFHLYLPLEFGRNMTT